MAHETRTHSFDDYEKRMNTGGDPEQDSEFRNPDGCDPEPDKDDEEPKQGGAVPG